jgi:hypothetical protein
MVCGRERRDLWTIAYAGQVVRYQAGGRAEFGRRTIGRGDFIMHARAGARGRVALFTDGAPIRVLSPELEVIAEVPIDHTRAVSGAGGDRRGAERSRCRSII